MIIYPLDPLGANPKDENSITIFQENDDVIIGFAIVFPKSNTQHTVEFAINTSLANDYIQMILNYLFMLFFKIQKDIVELLYHSMNIHILIFPLSLICVIYKLS